MPVSKVVYDGSSLIDLTGDTVAADKVLSGYTAHDKAGNAVTGTHVCSGLPSTISVGDTPVAMCQGISYALNNDSMNPTEMTLTIKRAGSYRFKWLLIFIPATSSLATTQIYKNGSAAGVSHDSSDNEVVTQDVECAAGDVVTIYMKGHNKQHSRYGGVANMTACINWDNGM